MEEREVSLKAYVLERFGREIGLAVENYILEHPDVLDLKKVRVPGELTGLHVIVTAVNMLDLPDLDIRMEIIAAAIVSVCDEKCADEKETVNQLFRLQCQGNLACGLCDFSIQNVSARIERIVDEDGSLILDFAELNSASKWYLSDEMVPYIDENALEGSAEAFLRLYYPEARRAPMAIDPYVLAERMGLSVVKHRIDKDQRVYGQIYFRAAEAVLYDEARDAATKLAVQPGTIVVDEKANFMRNAGTFRTTIVHECVHWRYHRKAFMLEQLILGEEATAIRCRVDGVADEAQGAATQQMEWQANRLTPRIQMPREMFLQCARRAIQKHLPPSKHGDFPVCEAMPGAVRELAELFDVSPTAAKLRLIEVGYPQAEGALIEVNGRVVPPHTWRAGTLAENETFTIPLGEAARLFCEDASFRKAAQGHLYIDGHFVLNDGRYVEVLEDGNMRMTDYARWHMDECCLVFSLAVQGEMATRYARECYLNRSDGLPFTLDFGFAKDEADVGAKKLQAILEIQREEEAVIKVLEAIEKKTRTPHAQNTGKEWDFLIKWQGSNQTKLANETKLNREKINRIVKLREEPDRNTAILMCLGLHLPPRISFHMLERCLVPLSPERSFEHRCLYVALTFCYKDDVETTRAALQAAGIVL